MIRHTLLGAALLVSLGAVAADKPVPDFSGVYFPIQARMPGGGSAPPLKPGEPPPPPTRSAPSSDGSQGRGPRDPQLTPPYLAKWEEIRKTRVAGSPEYDNSANCLPPGMPAMMSMTYGMEIMQTKDKITFFSELNDALRRVYLDGRKPTQKHLDDPTYAGYSTGHWEGDTLVIETVALHTRTFIEGFNPHSEKMKVYERIRLVEPTLLEDQITVEDPEALTKPWSITRRYRKAEPRGGKDELREFVCPEGMAIAK